MARRANHRTRIDTPERKAQLVAMLEKGIEPPSGCELATDEERELWKSYVTARTPDDWRTFDLFSLFKVVKFEAEIREQTRQLQKEGYLIKTRQGTKNNPRLAILRSLQNMQMPLIRSLSINALSTGPGQLRHQAEVAQQLARRAKEGGNANELLNGRE